MYRAVVLGRTRGQFNRVTIKEKILDYYSKGLKEAYYFYVTIFLDFLAQNVQKIENRFSKIVWKNTKNQKFPKISKNVLMLILLLITFPPLKNAENEV